MKSKLDITEFRDRLKNNTKIGLPHLQMTLGLFSIFFYSSKIFYGKFNDSTFQLTINYNFTFPNYIIKGKYQNINNELKLNYSVQPINKIGIVLFKIFPVLAIIIGNCFFYFNFKKNIPNFIYIIFNLLIVFTFFYSRWSLKRENKKLIKRFNKLFEIVD